MSGTQSGWRYRKAGGDSGGTWHHPLSFLPSVVVDQIINDDSQFLMTKGTTYYFNHMHRWEGPVAEGAAGGWLLSGTTGAATIVLGDVPAGTIVLTGDSTSGANPTLAIGAASTGANFLYAVGKRMWVFIRCKLVTVATTEVFIGLGTPDTSPCVTGTHPSDGLFFYKASTDTKMSFQARKDGTPTAKATITGTLVDDIYTVLGFYIDELGNIMPYQDGAALTAGYIAAGTANIPGSGDPMQPMIGILGASMTMTIDWVLFAQEI